MTVAGDAQPASANEWRREQERIVLEAIESGNWQVTASELREHVRRALCLLARRDAEILRLRFGLDGEDEHTLQQIGDKYHLCRERIRQIERRALRTLRKPGSGLQVWCGEVAQSENVRGPWRGRGE